MARTRVRVVVDNRQAIILRPYPYETLLKYWSFTAPQWHFIRHKYVFYTHGEVRYRWDGKIKFLKRDRLPVGLFWATYKEISKTENIKFVITKKVSKVDFSDTSTWLSSTGEYVFQNNCADIVADKIHYGKGGLILNATGSGKTRIAAMVASRLDCELLFVVDQLDLLKQAQKDISSHLGEKVGKVGESKFKLQRVTVATRQTLALHCRDKKFKNWFDKIDVIFIDELHEQMNKSNFNILQSAKPKAVIGLTATLGLSKKEVRLKAYSLSGPELFSYPLRQGMDEGVLSHGIVIQFLYNNPIAETFAWTAQKAYDTKVVDNAERNMLIGRIVKRAHKLGKYVFVLVDRLKHLSNLSDLLKDIPHKIVAGQFRGKKIQVTERHKTKEKFEKGKVRVILANKVFKKGIDVKRLDVIIDAGGRPSANDTIQKFGRGIRRHSDKQGLIYIDITDVDAMDKHRQPREKKNWIATAAKKRKRALRKVGITVKQVRQEEGTKRLFKKAEKYLQREVKQPTGSY